MSNVSKGGLFQDQRLSVSPFFALQTSGGPELVTWSNLLSLGSNKAANSEETGIINMEDDDSDDFSDHETSMPEGPPGDSGSTLGNIFNSFNTNSPPVMQNVEGSKPFEILRDLLCHHAHLAVFMNYVISNSDPSALVSNYVIHNG